MEHLVTNCECLGVIEQGFSSPAELEPQAQGFDSFDG
jgi:hypothetical protein